MLDQTRPDALPDAHLAALRALVDRVEDVNWVLTGSAAFAIQGLPVTPHDLDVQTDQAGAYEIARRLSEHVIEHVAFRESDTMRSHFGKLRINGVLVEIMGDIEKRGSARDWSGPPDLLELKRFVEYGGMTVPVLDLTYEAEAYEAMGRTERAAMLRTAILKRNADLGHPEMTLDDVIGLLDLFDRLGLTVWIDGGWGVDALLGEQTRPHADLDIEIQRHEAQRLRDELAALGYEDIETDDRTDWNFVMGNRDGKQVDFHVIEIAEDGQGIYGPADDAFMFPASSLRATGTIGGRQVRCLSAEFQVESHSGYELKPTDVADVHALCDRFGIPLPPEYG